MTNKKNENNQSLSLKIQITPFEDSWKDVRKILSDLQYEINKIMNISVFTKWSYDSRSNLAKDMRNEKVTLQDITGNDKIKNLMTYTSRRNKTRFLNTNGEVIEQCQREAFAKYDFNRKQMIINEGFIPHFGSNSPIMIKNSAYDLLIDEKSGSYIVNIRRLFTKEYAKKLYNGIEYSYVKNKKKKTIKYGRSVNSIGMKFKLLFGKSNYSKDVILKCLTGEYKKGQAKLWRNSRNNKWFFIISYSFEPKKKEKGNKEVIMGIDLGIAKPVTMAINDGSKYGYHQYIGTRNEIDGFYKYQDYKRKQMQWQLKWCSESRRGHGVKTLLKPVYKTRDKVANFKELKNHEYSKRIIREAIKHEVTLIQMEDLTGIATGESAEENPLLKHWNYYDLEQKIKYKAEKEGIKFKLIKPKNTSARCSKCGYINGIKYGESKYDEDGWRPDQAHFHCLKCGYKENADVNAAKNIAIKNIDEKIKEDVERQKEENKNEK